MSNSSAPSLSPSTTTSTPRANPQPVNQDLQAGEPFHNMDFIINAQRRSERFSDSLRSRLLVERIATGLLCPPVDGEGVERPYLRSQSHNRLDGVDGEGIEHAWADLPRLPTVREMPPGTRHEHLDDAEWIPIGRSSARRSPAAERALADAQSALANVDVAVATVRLALEEVDYARVRADAAVAAACAALLASHLDLVLDVSLD
ncbi:hypothetical protein C8R46DRAFT_1226822 [Mycena filopes]|nr:hypothetical protein C8R46DRAFT_1226822 [Mycena filopes]